MGTIVGSIRVTPPQAVKGQSVEVDVLDKDGASLRDRADTIIRIDGITGGRQFRQFPLAGTFPIRVEAWRNGDTEYAEATVDILPDTAKPPVESGGMQLRMLSLRAPIGVPLLRVAHTPNRPTAVGFSLGLGGRFAAGLTTGSLESRDKPVVSAAADLKAVSTKGGPALSLLGFPHQDDGAAIGRASTQYIWDFGDGSTATTDEPNVEHDFAAALGPDALHRLFDVRVRIQEAGQKPLEVVRTLSVHNAYAICKQLGTIVPRSRVSGFATPVLGGWSLTLTVDNIEPVAIVLTHRQITPVLGDGDDLGLGGVEMLIKSITVGAKSTVAVPITVPKGVVPKEANAIAVVLVGTTADGHSVRVEAQADISHEDRTRSGLSLGGVAVTHLGPFREALDELVAGHGKPPVNPNWSDRLGAGLEKFLLGRVGQFEAAMQKDDVQRTAHLQAVRVASGAHTHVLSTKRLEGLQAQLAGAAAAVVEQSMAVLDGGQTATDLSPIRALMDARLVDRQLFDMVPTVQPVDGFDCDPNNVPDDLGDWVCQATPEQHEVVVPGRFMNARKGDIVLSPGGMGPIGRLLRSVMPPQRYSHCGIMTRNYDQITHSTASEERLRDYPVGSILGDPFPTDGHRPDVVKYGWPGVVTQSVEQAIHGGDMVDPESGKQYTISSFSARNEFMDVGGVWEVVPPLVVKPDPMQETPELRRLLHRVADTAFAQTGKSHYRFYCYTDPTIGETTVAPDDAGWAAGTFPSVCSSFIWMMLKRAGVNLEAETPVVARTDLEPTDVAAGAQVNATTRDGLYLYTASERLAAARYLFGYLHNQVRAKEGETGILGEFADAFSDMADDVANQMVNAFASDWCDKEAKDSDRWKQAVDANAVSPDNILLWDSPQARGLYGFAAPLVYREPRREVITVHRWKLVPTKGALSGVVRQNGVPVAGAMVQVFDGKTDFTDAAGRYRLEAVPFGNYRVKAAKDGGSVYLTADVPIHLEQQEATLDLELKGPSEDFRVVVIHGNIHMVDYEDFDSDERGDQPFHGELFVGPYGTHAERTFVGKCGGEVRVEFRVVVDWQPDRSVAIYFEHKFFEGDSEDTGDLDGWTDKGFGLAADHWQSWNSNIKSGGSGESHVTVSFTNALNPN